MIDAETLRRLALALPGTTAAPHVDRIAFRVRTIFATLAPDGRSANLRLSPEDQEFRCTIAPHGFAPLDNAWGRQGWTRADLAALSEPDLAAALESAHRLAASSPRRRR